MPSSVRPKSSASSSRSAPTITPMSERQQMALLMQMTSSNPETGSRSPTGPNSRSRDRNERGETPLHLAAIKGDVEQVSRLLAGRADPNIADFAGWTPLHEACNHGWYDVAYKLISCGASVNAKGLDNETPLHDAVNNCHQKLVKLLVERGADIYAKNAKGKSPYDNAVPQIAAILLNPSTPICESGPSRLQPRLRDEKKLVDSSSTNSTSSTASTTISSSGSSKQRTSSAEDSAANTAISVMDTSSKGSSTSSSTSVTTTITSSASLIASSTVDDIYEFKSVKESDSPTDQHRKTPSTDPLELDKDAVDPLSLPISPGEGDEKESGKRTFAEMESTSTIANTDDNTTVATDDDGRRKKRKDDSTSSNTSGNKDSKSNTQQQQGHRSSAVSGIGGSVSGIGVSSSKTVGKTGIGTGKASTAASNAPKSVGGGSAANVDKKSPVASPKSTNANSDPEPDNDNNGNSKTDLKVPPLKIVIPSQNHGSTGCEPETALSRNGKNSGTRGHHHHHHHQALPYVVSTGGTGNSNSSGSTATSQSSNTHTTSLATDVLPGGAPSSSLTVSNNSTSGASNTAGGSASSQAVATSSSTGDKDKDKDSGGTGGSMGATTTPSDPVIGKSTSGGNSTDDGKGNGNVADDQRGQHQRVLRSSHRSGATSGGGVDRSNNSSPQLQRSHSPSPNSSPAAPQVSETVTTVSGTTLQASGASTKVIDTNMQTSNSSDSEPSMTPTAASASVSTTITNTNAANTSTNSSNSSTSSNNGSNSTHSAPTTNNNNSNSNGNNSTTSGNVINSSGPTTSGGTSSTSAVELHPRKRKMKPSKEVAGSSSTTSTSASSGSGGSGTAPTGNSAAGSGESTESTAGSELHPHEQPIMNCYQLFLNIRKQIEKRRKGLFPVQPKPPQGFKDYLMNRCSYVLNGTAPTTPNINFPSTLPPPMKDIFTEQEKERYRLRMQHVIEKEKLVLSVEQEILRVHGRAARALANQSLPFSVCTILRDEEVYNLITPEQEEKDRNARSRYNGRLFLSWLQDVDDKWEKIKEHMLLRHHNEAESLHAVQKMNWEWKMKELSLCDAKSTPCIDELHVPMVHVSDDFDLLPT